jgi:hypothetical protein
MKPGLNDKILCYLTDNANNAVEELTKLGLDQDLALSVLEQLWDEESIYELPALERPVAVRDNARR